MSPAPPPPAANLQQRRRRVLAVASIGSFMGPLDVSVVALALPAMSRAHDLSFAAAVWVQAAYFLPYTLVLVPGGRIADQLGRLRVWRIGIVMFGVASLAAGLSPSSETLLAARAIQGMGGGLLAATATALVSAVFPAGERGRALGLNVTALYLGLSTGPVLGGVIVDQVGWRWIFLVNVPVAALAVLASLGLREAPRGSGRPALDPLGVALLGAGLASAMVGLTFGPIWGWGAPRTVVLIALGTLALAAFLVAEQRVRAPVLDIGLFRANRLFAFGNLAALLNYTAAFAAISLTAILLQIVGGHSPTRAGLIMLAQPAVMVCLSPLAGRLSDRIGSRALASGGMAVIAAGLATLALVPEGVDTPAVIGGLAAIGLGMAAFASPNISAVMGATHHARFGVAAAVLASMRSIGQSLSLAVLGSLAAAPLGAAGAHVLHGDTGAADAASYLDGYRLAMAVGAGIALIGAALSLARGPAAQRSVSVIAPPRST